jgi:rhodanese-related sulfurtransferase
MDVREAAEQHDRIVLLDVRERDEWDRGHIDGALHVPMGELAARQSELPTDATIVCVCRSGNRSGVVAGALVRAGYRAENLEGGMLAWAAAGLDFVASDGGPGRVS